MPDPSSYLPPRDLTRIHILGTGSVGKLVAHSLKDFDRDLPISLIFHRPAFLKTLPVAENVEPISDAHDPAERPFYRTRQASITLTTDKIPETTGPFDAELALPDRNPSTAIASRVPLPEKAETEAQYVDLISNGPISCLVLTVKAYQTVSALNSIKHRLNPDSTILFLQNGMGIIEEVNAHVWPDDEADARPNYMLGINSHGVHATGALSATHAGRGAIFLGLLPRIRNTSNRKPRVAVAAAPPGSKSIQEAQLTAEEIDEFPRTSRHILRALTHVPVLAAVPLPPTALHMAQLEKLAVNCIINPLTVLLDARNGALLANHSLDRATRLLLAEISFVFCNLPELKGIPTLATRFSPERLENVVVGVATRTAGNISSMLQDVRRGVRTEIDYLNGYVVRRAEERLLKCKTDGDGRLGTAADDAAAALGRRDLAEADVKKGISPAMNYLMMHLVKAKQQMVSREVEGFSPFEGRGRRSGERL